MRKLNYEDWRERDVSNNLSAKTKVDLSRNGTMKYGVPNGNCFCIDNQKNPNFNNLGFKIAPMTHSMKHTTQKWYHYQHEDNLPHILYL